VKNPELVRSRVPLVGIAVLVVVVVVGLVLVAGGGRGGVEISGAWMPQPARPDVAGIFMTLTNSGDAADRLVGGATDVADVVEIHETVMDAEGRTMMQPLANGIEIPAGGSVELMPGGLHVMLREVTAELVEGDTVAVTLRFEQAGEVTIDVPVQAPREMMDGGMGEEMEGGMGEATESGMGG
jgi:periplasmic copper chaperone A